MAESLLQGNHEDLKTEQPRKGSISEEQEKSQLLQKQLQEMSLKLQSSEHAFEIQAEELSVTKESLQKQLRENEAFLESRKVINVKCADLETQMVTLNRECQSLASQVKELKSKSRCSCQCILVTLSIAVLVYSTLSGFAVLLEEAQTSAFESDQAFNILVTKVIECGVKIDPPVDSIPDFSTIESRAALSNLGSYSDQDLEILLIRRGPILLTTGVYTGQWNIRNETHGYGKFSYMNGDIYEGDWRNGNMTGKGRYIWADGTVYIGEFVDNQPDGIGSKEYPNDRKEDGTWENGELDGYGMILFDDDSKLSVCFGQFLRGKLDGLGLCIWKNEEVYLGFWKAGLKHGMGALLEAEKLYLGNWVEGRKSGRSCVISAAEDALNQIDCIQEWVLTGFERWSDTQLSFAGVDGNAVLNKTRKAFQY